MILLAISLIIGFILIVLGLEVRKKDNEVIDISFILLFLGAVILYVLPFIYVVINK